MLARWGWVCWSLLLLPSESGDREDGTGLVLRSPLSLSQIGTASESVGSSVQGFSVPWAL